MSNGGEKEATVATSGRVAKTLFALATSQKGQSYGFGEERGEPGMAAILEESLPMKRNHLRGDTKKRSQRGGKRERRERGVV